MEVAGTGHLPHREHFRSDWDSALLTLEILTTEPRAGNNPGDRFDYHQQGVVVGNGDLRLKFKNEPKMSSELVGNGDLRLKIGFKWILEF